MFPYIEIFGFRLPMYGLMMFLGAVAMIVTFLLIVKNKNIERLSFNRMLFILIIVLPIAYAGAFVFDGIFHSIKEGYLSFGGKTWLGSVLVGFPFLIFAYHKWVPAAKGRALEYFSMVIPGIVLGHALGRMGCFFGGCCFGKVTDSVFGIVFPEGSSAAILYPAADGRSLPVLPTQLFEAVFEFVLFVFMILTRRKLIKYDAEIYMTAYGVFRFMLEFLRGDDRGSLGSALSPAQVISIILVAAGVLLILFEKGRIFKKLSARCDEWAKKADEAVRERRAEAEFSDKLTAVDKLFALKEKGAITEDEYEEKKKQLLNTIVSKEDIK